MKTLTSAVASLVRAHFTSAKAVKNCVPARNEAALHTGALDACLENSQRHRKQDQTKLLIAIRK
jgi:hypothetical protein